MGFKILLTTTIRLQLEIQASTVERVWIRYHCRGLCLEHVLIPRLTGKAEICLFPFLPLLTNHTDKFQVSNLCIIKTFPREEILVKLDPYCQKGPPSPPPPHTLHTYTCPCGAGLAVLLWIRSPKLPGSRRKSHGRPSRDRPRNQGWGAKADAGESRSVTTPVGNAYHGEAATPSGYVGKQPVCS